MASEHSDVDIRAIAGFGAGLVVLCAAVYVVIWLVFGFLSAHSVSGDAPRNPITAGLEDRLPPEPRLQTTPKEDLKELRDRQENRLKSYEWVDKNAGLVRIPIDEAMRLTVEKGLPTRTAEGAAK